MANIQESSFAPDASVGGSFGFASSRILLPGTVIASDSLVRVTNAGPCHVAIALGDVTVVAVNSASLLLLAGQSIYLTRGAATYIAGIACGGPNNTSTVNITTGN